VAVVAFAPPAALTMKVTADDVEPLNAAVLVEVNRAVSWCDPIVNDDVVIDAAPLITVAGLPMVVSPSLNCTLPVADGATTALSVTDVPGQPDVLGTSSAW
jgi:hypothetical protein